MLGLDPARRTVMVTGGSQGALHLDQAVSAALPVFVDRKDLQLLVLAGPGREGAFDGAAERAGAARVMVIPFLDRMELGYAAADLVVSRAGATTIAELAVCGLPSVLVPYPHATENHQAANARELARVGAAVVVADAELTPSTFARSRHRVARRSGPAAVDGRERPRVGETGRRGPLRVVGGRGGERMTDARERYVPPSGSIPTLDVPSLDGVARLHMIGIGGAGMRNLAKLLLARGIAVSGSDLKDSKGSAELRELGADVAVGHDPRTSVTPTPSSSRAPSGIATWSSKRRVVAGCRCGLGRRRWRL